MPVRGDGLIDDPNGNMNVDVQTQPRDRDTVLYVLHPNCAVEEM